MVWERVAWWEDVTLVELPLTNGNGSGVTGGLTIWNHDDADAGHDNYVEVASTAAVGSAPGSLQVELTNTIGGSRDYGNVYVGQNWGSEPLNRILEAEAGSHSGTNVVDGLSSGGYYVDLTLPTSYGSTAIWDFLLGNTELDAFGGRAAALLARFAVSPTAGTYMYWSLTSSSVEVYRSPEVLLGLGQLQVTGVLRLPPTLRLMTGIASLQLSLYARNAGGVHLGLDFVQLTPTDGWRRLFCLADGSPTISFGNGGQLVDDGTDGEERIYWYEGSKRQPVWGAEGLPLLLEPGKTQRFYFLHDEQSYGCMVGDTWSARMWTRARRLTI